MIEINRITTVYIWLLQLNIAN